MNINTPSLGTLQPISSVGSANATDRAARVRDQLFNQRMEETLKSALDLLQTSVDMATNASSDSTVIDERLANFWNNFSDKNENGNSLGLLFSTKKDELNYVKEVSLAHLATGVGHLRREIQNLPAGAERDKAMARLDEFDATSKEAIANDYRTGFKNGNNAPRGHYSAWFHAPNYEALNNQRMEETQNASSDSTVIDERLANFWNNFSDEDENGNSLGQLFSTKKSALNYVKGVSLAHLATGVGFLRHDIQNMPAGAERDKAMARLKEFDATSKQAIENDYATGVINNANKKPIGHYYASFHAPNYEALNNQRLEETQKRALDSLPTSVDMAKNASSDSIVLDERLANFWNDFSKKNENGFGRLFPTPMAALASVKRDSLAHLATGVRHLRREIQNLPAGAERDKAMARLDEFDATSKQAIENDYVNDGKNANNQSIGQYSAWFHAPNYEALNNQRMEETQNASSDSTVIDERLANFWNDYSQEDEDRNSIWQPFHTEKDALNYAKGASLAHLATGVGHLRREIQNLPAGAERDKAMARLDEFDATSKKAITNDYATRFRNVNHAHRGYYHAVFQAPNYEALKSTSGPGSRIDTIGLLEKDDEEVQLLPRRQLPRAEEPGDDDDNITFRPNIGTGLPRNEFEANPGANPRGIRTMEETPEDRGEPSVTAFSITPRNELFAELELQTELVNQLQAHLQR